MRASCAHKLRYCYLLQSKYTQQIDTAICCKACIGLQTQEKAFALQQVAVSQFMGARSTHTLYRHYTYYITHITPRISRLYISYSAHRLQLRFYLTSVVGFCLLYETNL